MKRRKKRNYFLRVFLFIIVLAAILIWYGFWIEPDLVVVRHYQLQTQSGGTEILRLVQISDLQIGDDYTIENMKHVIKKIETAHPDVVLFTGDLFENYSVCGSEMEPAVTALLQQIEAPKGKYAVWGNRDYGGGAAKAYRRILKTAGFALLCNSSVEITTTNNQKVLLCGLDDALFGNPDGQKFLQQEQNYAYQILMLHEPDIAQLWSNSAFQLILAGHSHGGQVRLPFWQGLKTVLAEKYTRHFYTLNKETGMQLYVNTGLGTSHLPVRFGVPPEVVVFDLTL